MISLQFLYVKNFRRVECNRVVLAGHWDMNRCRVGDTRTGEVKVARAAQEMTLAFGHPEMANELEMASQARAGERDKYELP